MKSLEPSQSPSPQNDIEKLDQVARIERYRAEYGLEIDRHLPGGGLALGALHEVAAGGIGAIDDAAAALFAAGIAARTRGKVLWCITRPDLFAPALAQAGPKSDRVIYLEAGDDKSVLACFAMSRLPSARPSPRSGPCQPQSRPASA